MRVWVGAMAVLVVGLSNVAAGQRPNAQLGRFEVPGMDWSPTSAWRARAAQVRANRWAAIQRGDIGALNARRPLFSLQAPGAASSAFAVTGTFFVPVIPIAYNNVPVPYPIADFQDVLFGLTPPNQRPYTLKSYYEQISNGRIQLFGRVFESVRVDSSNTFYENNCNGIGVLTACPDGGQRFGNMLIAALDSISNRPGGDTIWTQFDNDGPDGLPNSGDDDGDIDFVTFLQPTVDGACGPPGIWAHRFVISAWNNGSKYVTKTPGKNGSGQFLRIDNYTMQSQLGGGSGCSPNFIMPIGTVSHETGHAFGLPDLYDTDRGSGTEGIGEWGIMGSGNYSRAYSPTGYDAWSLNELGWVTIDTLNASRTVTTGPRQTSDTVFLARLTANRELLLIENRQALESDTAALNPNAGGTAATCRSNCRKAPGLLLWHIDLGRIDAGRPSNRINTGPIQGVALEQADGLNNLRSSGSSRNRGDSTDAYPGSTGNTRWALTTNPAARSNFGEYAGFIVDRIQSLPNQAVRFRFLRRDPSVVRSALAGVSVRVNDQLWGRFEEVVPQGETLRIDVDSVQDVLTGRTRARFLAWSVGGPRTQVITSGAKPDTITASFAADHRLQVTVTGAGQGTVTANRPGDLAAGVFFSEGTPVVVTATPAAGSLFVGWRGDTTIASRTITIPMARPYDLEASFVIELPVAVADATAEILGTAKLTTDQKAFLDQLGNRNGLYDVGDYLALLKRSGQAASPELLKALATAQSVKAKGAR